MDGKPSTFVFKRSKMTVEELKVILQPIIEKAGYELIELSFEKSYGTDTLTAFIYKKGGVDLNDCEKVSVLLDPILDDVDFGSQGYNFNVSSPGLDRPIVTMDDYRRNVDEDIEIVFKQPIGKKKSAHGTLVFYDEETFALKGTNGKETVYNKQDALCVRPYIHF